MTVYSINKGVYDKANMSASSNGKAQSSTDAFVAALKSAGNRFDTHTALPNAEVAMKQAFTKPVEDPRPAKPAEKAEKPQPKETQRQAPREKEQAKAKDDTAPAKAKDNSDTETAAKPDEKGQVTSEDGEAKAETGAEKNVVAQDAGQDTVEAPQVAAVVQPVQQAATQVEDETVETVADGEQAINPDELGKKAAQTGQQQASDQDADGQDAGQQADGADFAAQAAAQANKGRAHQGQAKEQTSDAAQDQADQLADMLNQNGTPAHLQVKVSQTSSTQDQSSALNMAADLDAGLDAAALPLTPGQGSGAGQNGGAGQGTANAGQQLAGNPALDNALAAQGKATDAKPFAAALVAQMEGTGQTQAPQGQQTGQAVAGLSGPAGTQATQKAQAPQAPQAPRQQQHVQQQVMEQVNVQIAKQSKDGVDTIKIQLKPVELGSIEVKLDVAHDGKVSGTVTADNKETLAMLQKDSRSLEKALQDAGYKADSGSLSFNLREGSQQNAQNNFGQGGGRRRRMAEATGIDATSAGIAQSQSQGRMGGGRSGVDIQV
jgi:hypothetical protein